MTAAPDELQALIEEALHERRIATAEELGATATLWLAAVPVWTRSAAEAVSFPVESVPDFVRRACEAGWCETRGSARGQGTRELRFWMPDTVRREVIGAVISRVGYESAAEQVTGIAIDLAPRIRLSSQFPDVQSTGALTAWTDLVGQVNPGERVGRVNLVSASARLVEQAQRAVEAGDLAGAQDLAEAGEALAAVFGGTAEQALSRARRLLALGLQRRQDERALDRYLDRPELSDAVGRLLRPEPRPDPAREAARQLTEIRVARPDPPRPWALHLRGVGGVGKTMLIRYLASGRYARDHGIAPIPIARADFDHISPDYPVRRPVQLLLELADELARHTAGNYPADQALTAFRARAARAHEAVSGLREAGAPPLGNPEVAKAVDDFGAVLNSLGNVLLILDTCEELAKADMGNPAAPAVRATLDILERLHEKAPSVRVLFAGRRPLPERAHLVVQPVAGFTVAEARRYLAREYLARRSPDAHDREPATARPLPPGLADAMIRQSPAVDGPVPAQGQLPERVSPFDLALYAAWADEDPELSVAQVDRGSDAYIEGRIIERLNDPLVVRALPVLASAGRCRVTTIAELLNCDATTLGGSLAGQEWTDAFGRPANGTGHVAATPALARRLRGYFGKDERRAEFAARNAALASFLLPRLRDAPLSDIDVDELIAALRLSPPAEAAALWDCVASRAVAPPGRWGTVLNMTRRILGEWEPGDGGHGDGGHPEWEEGAWPTMPALRAAVTAAHIAGSRRHSPLFNARSHWEIVRDWAGRHPDQKTRRLLESRATLGLLDSPSGPLNRQQLRVTTPELVAAAADALHRLLDAGDAGTAASLAAVVVDNMHAYESGMRSATEMFEVEDDSYPAWMQETIRGRSWAYVANARLLADSQPAEALSELDRAERLAAAATYPEPDWPDWIPPDDLLAGVRIERGLIAPPDDLSILDEWEAYAADHLDTIDGERLASLCLRIRLRHGVVAASTAKRWEALDVYDIDRVPTCTAHDLVPPLCVSVAGARMSAGEPDRALDYLSRRRNQARGTRYDEATVRHADAATIKIVRRLRLTNQRSLLNRLAQSRDRDTPSRDLRNAAWRAIAVAYREQPLGVATSGEDLRPADWHAWWQCQVVSTNELYRNWGYQPSLDAADVADVADVQADIEEMRLVGHPEARSVQSSLAFWPDQPTLPTPPVRSAEPYRDVRAALRTAALAGQSFTPRDGVPPRLLAEMAFEEAELTALRLPDVADRLYDFAVAAYAQAGDWIGHLLALSAIGNRRRGFANDHLAARDAVARQYPALAAKLNGPPEGAGPWRYWAERVQGRVSQPLTPTPQAWAGPGQPTDAGGQIGQAGLPQGYGQQPGLEALLPPTGAPSTDPDFTQDPPERAIVSTRPRGWVYLLASGLILLTGFGALDLALLQSGGHSVLGLAGGLSAVAAGLGPALVGMLSRIPKIARLADDRGVGATRLGNLRFQVRISPDNPASTSRLGVGLRPWRTAPARARAMIWLLRPAARVAFEVQVRRIRVQDNSQYSITLEPYERMRRRMRLGYSFILTQDSEQAPIRLSWRSALPRARSAWWRRGRGTALGIIETDRQPTGMSAPWERILSASLSPEAAGRIEWIRVVSGREYQVGAPAQPSGGTQPNDDALPARPFQNAPQQVLQAPSEWTASLGEGYSSTSGPSLRPYRWADSDIEVQHVIGRAVATSAGPAMDVSGDSSVPAEAPSSAPGGRQLLGTGELREGNPFIVILQGAPIDAPIGGGPPDDQAEKLSLAAELVTDHVPAVLLLPVLPASIAPDIAKAVTARPVTGRGEVQRLLTELREIIAPHVPPPVLDDIVLFLNESRYRP